MAQGAAPEWPAELTPSMREYKEAGEELKIVKDGLLEKYPDVSFSSDIGYYETKENIAKLEKVKATDEEIDKYVATANRYTLARSNAIIT